jgi:hypothetical protein
MTPRVSVGITAPRHLVVLVGLPIIPIVQAKATLPRFGHGQIVLPAQRVWELLRGGQASSAEATRPIAPCPQFAERLRDRAWPRGTSARG